VIARAVRRASVKAVKDGFAEPGLERPRARRVGVFEVVELSVQIEDG